MKPGFLKNKIKFSLLIGFFLPAMSFAQSGHELFTKYCTACHTVGGGDLVGPDLKGVTEKYDETWLTGFIRSSQSMIKQGDQKAFEIFRKYNKIPMPDQPVSDEEVALLLNYIKNESAVKQIEDTLAEKKPEKATAYEYNSDKITTGLALFKGKQTLTNGGVSCISCHKLKNDAVIAGGTMAKDLTNTYNVMGKRGIKAILANPPFPLMAVSYKNHPLSASEINALTDFLAYSSEQALYQHPREYTSYFLLISAALWWLLIGIISLIWIKRKRKRVNESIYKRQIEIY